MSLNPTAFRRAVIGVTAAAAMMLPQAANALDLKECQGLSGLIRSYVKEQPKGTFSEPFIKSVRGYVVSDGKSLDCAGPPQIAVYNIDDLTGWINIENLAKANRINVAREVKLVPYEGSDPRLPNLIAQRDRNVGQQASIAPQ